MTCNLAWRCCHDLHLTMELFSHDFGPTVELFSHDPQPSVGLFPHDLRPTVELFSNDLLVSPGLLSPNGTGVSDGRLNVNMLVLPRSTVSPARPDKNGATEESKV